MGFENPTILIATLGAAIPLLIHYLLRRRAREVPLDSVIALVLSEGIVAVRLRWAHRLLLAVRIALMALIALAFARPYLERAATAGLGSGQPIAIALVLDTSLSMQAAPGGVSAFDRARQKALALLSEVPPDSEVFLAVSGPPAALHPSERPGWDARSAGRFVSRLKPTDGGSGLGAAIRLASDALRSTPLRERRIVVFSDFLASSLREIPEAVEGCRVIAVDVGAPVRNAAVVEATATPAPDISADHVRVHVAIRNDATEPIEPVVTVHLGLHHEARKVACAASETCETEFVIRADGGTPAGEVRLPADDLNQDNVRFFTLRGRERNAVLLVNGAPRSRADLDAAYFVERALRLRSSDHPGFAVRTVLPDQLSALHLSAAAAVGLLNVAKLPDEILAALRGFVEAGGGVFVSAGENASGESWADGFQGLLPGAVRDRLQLQGSPPVARVLVEPRHPVFDARWGETGPLPGVQFRQITVLEPDWPAGTRTIASLPSGLPLLVERRVGRGVVLVWLASVDRLAGDFPLHPHFAPLIRRVFAYLTEVSGTSSPDALLVGESRTIEAPEGPLWVVPPAGPPVRLETSAEFRSTAVPGVYRIETDKGDRREVREVFVVNVDPSETRFERPETLPALFRAPAATEAATPAVRKVPLVSYLVAALLILLVAEGYLRAEA